MVISALLVLAFGGAGALLRFLVDGFVQASRLGEFPLGTLIVNLSGALMLGLLVGIGASHRTMMLLGTASLGAYTTFSTWMLETHRPAQNGELALACANVFTSLLAGALALALGRKLGRLL